MQNASESPYITVEEAAGLLRVSRRTLSRWVRADIVPSTKIGGRRLLRRDGLAQPASAHTNDTSLGVRADTAILVECIADAAAQFAENSNVEQARRITRYASAVLSVDEHVARAWREEDWDFAAARAAADALHAVRSLA